jgi:hypothetical protein
MSRNPIPMIVAVTLVAQACHRTESTQPPPPVSSLPPASSPSVAAPSPSANGTGNLAACNAHDAWFGTDGVGQGEGRPEQNQAALILKMKEWSPQCRAAALQSECEKRCDDFISGLILKATSTPSEKRELLRVRYRRNTQSVDAAMALMGKVMAFASYARSIISSPRSGAYQNPGASLDEQAQEIAGGNPCLTRMRADFARIDSLDQEVEAQLSALPIGFVVIRSTLSYAKFCVNCGSDRSSCKDMSDSIKDANEVIAEWKKLVASDRKALATLDRSIDRVGGG